MYIKYLKADGFKNLKGVSIYPDPKFNMITGMNAQGKTNLLESIWLMTGCKSFRGSKDRDNIGFEREFMDLGMKFQDSRREQIITYKTEKKNSSNKILTLNGVGKINSRTIFSAFKSVVFTPEDINLINGSPEVRRNFIDLCSSQVNIDTMEHYYDYCNAMKQRNALLKKVNLGECPLRTAEDQMVVWNIQLAVKGCILSQKRYKYITELNLICSKLYTMITNGKEKLSLEYNSNVFGNSVPLGDDGDKGVRSFSIKLYESFEDDLRAGFTRYGAHRDDMIIKINGRNIKDFGSQGQKKTAALVMKLGQAEIFSKNKKESPVVLLDDVMGELDENRQRLVLDLIKDMQVFITTCNEDSVKGLTKGNIYDVTDGTVTLRK